MGYLFVSLLTAVILVLLKIREILRNQKELKEVYLSEINRLSSLNSQYKLREMDEDFTYKLNTYKRELNQAYKKIEELTNILIEHDLIDMFSETDTGILDPKLLDSLILLGITEINEIDLDRIKENYKILAKKYHPDITKEDKETADLNMKLINQAYNYIMNKKHLF